MTKKRAPASIRYKRRQVQRRLRALYNSFDREPILINVDGTLLKRLQSSHGGSDRYIFSNGPIKEETEN